MEFLKYSLHEFRCQYWVWKCEGRIMPSDDHLGDFSTREAFCGLCYLLYYLFGDSFHSNQLFAVIETPGIFPDKFHFLLERLWWLAILHQIVEQHDSSFIFIWKVEANDLVNTIVDGLIELIRVVGGHDENDLFGRRTCPIKE